MNIALAIITKEDSVLIGKVRQTKLAEYGNLEYVFPCEHISSPAHSHEELTAEVKKQTNLDIEILRKIGGRTHPATENFTEYFHCTTKTDREATASSASDIEEFMWVKLTELSQYMPSLFGETKEYLESL